MDIVLQLIENADLCATPTLIAILYVVGSKMVEHSPHLYRWGIRTAAGAFLLYAGYAGIAQTPKTTDGWVFLLIHALVAGGIALGSAWILFAAVAFVIARPLQSTRQRFQTIRGWIGRRISQRQFERQELLADQERLRNQPERERVQREAEEQNRAETERKDEGKRRRQTARMDCELLWTALAPAIQTQFSREDLKTFFDRYLSDEQPPELVEQSATALKTSLETLYRNADPSRQFSSIHDVVVRFTEAEGELAKQEFSDPNMAGYLKLQLAKIREKHMESVILNLGRTRT